MSLKEYKQLDLADYELEEDDDSWTIKGWAATYDWDRGADKIVPGAMTESIERRHNRRMQAGKVSEVKFLYQHKEECIIGTPLVMIEDLEKGLWVEAKFIKDDDFPEARKAYKLAKMGYLISFSIGYLTIESEPKVKVKGQPRLLKKIDLMEFSLVAIPMNEYADVEEVKAMDSAITQEHPEEKEMTEAEFKSLSDKLIEAVRGAVLEALTPVEEEAAETQEAEEVLTEAKEEVIETEQVAVEPAAPVEEIKAEEVAEATESPVVVGGIDLRELSAKVDSLVASMHELTMTLKSAETEAPVAAEEVEVKSLDQENDHEIKGILESLKEIQATFTKDKV